MKKIICDTFEYLLLNKIFVESISAQIWHRQILLKYKWLNELILLQ